MTKFKRGAKAGALSGVVFSFVWLAALLYLPTIIRALRDWLWGPPPGIVVPIPSVPISFRLLVAFFGLALAVWLGMGVFFGVVFAALRENLPGETSVKKGVVLSIPFLFSTIWALRLLSGGYMDVGLVTLSLPVRVPVSVILWAFFGFLLGFFWSRFGTE